MMKCLLLPALLLMLLSGFGQDKFQLAPPMLKYPSAFFSGSTSFEVVFNQPGAAVHYTLTGKEPTEKDPLYSKAVPVNKKTIVKVKAFGKGYLPSETVTAFFINEGKTILQARYSKPNESYAGSKPDLLHDNIGGIVNYRSGTWVGFDSDTVTVDVQLKKKEAIQTILVNLLQDENSWIFLPEQILVYYYSDKEKTFLPAAKETFQHDTPGPKQCSVREIKPTAGISTDKLKLVFLPLKKIPDWHAGKGQHGWLFIDEIKVY